MIDQIAQAIVHDRNERTSLPPNFVPSPLAEVVLLSDLWSDIGEVRRKITQLAGRGTRGHVVQIVDPAEETFPYWGRVEFVEPEGGGSITAGRAEDWRADYIERIARHRAEIRRETDRLGWSFTIHRTDRPPSELLFALHGRIGAGATDIGMHAPAKPRLARLPSLDFATPSRRRWRHDRVASARLCPTARSDRAVDAAGAVVAAAAHSAAPAPHRFSADAASRSKSCPRRKLRRARRGGSR